MNLRSVWMLGVLITLAACGRSSFENAVGTRTMGQNQAALKAGIYEEASGAREDRAADVALPASTSISPLAPSGSPSPARARMIIRTGQISLEVDDFAAGQARVNALAAAAGGFVSGSSEQTDEKNRRYGSITCRVPSDRWDSFVQSIRGIGKVLSQSSNGNDVTEEYYDIEARLLAQLKLEEELLALMESARKGGLSDLLEIEREVARVRGEIESMQGRKRYLAEQSALSTLTVELKEPMALIEVQPGAFDPLWRSISESARVFSESVGALVTLGAAALPWMIVAFGLWKLVRRSRRSVVTKKPQE